jgi:hypothetical protein
MQTTLHIRTHHPLHILAALIRKAISHRQHTNVQEARIILVRAALTIFTVLVEGGFVDHVQDAVIVGPEVVHEVVMGRLGERANDLFCAPDLGGGFLDMGAKAIAWGGVDMAVSANCYYDIHCNIMADYSRRRTVVSLLTSSTVKTQLTLSRQNLTHKSSSFGRRWSVRSVLM